MLINCLILSIYTENRIPKMTPKSVALVPIVNPTKKKIFLIDLFLTPTDFKIAISLVLFFTNIVKIFRHNFFSTENVLFKLHLYSPYFLLNWFEI